MEYRFQQGILGQESKRTLSWTLSNNFLLYTCMDGMVRAYLLWEMCYVLINFIRHCVRGKSIQNYFKFFIFFLIWMKNLGSHTNWPVAKPLWIRSWLHSFEYTFIAVVMSIYFCCCLFLLLLTWIYTISFKI